MSGILGTISRLVWLESELDWIFLVRNECGKVELGLIAKFLKCSLKDVEPCSVDNIILMQRKKIVSSVVLVKNFRSERRNKVKERTKSPEINYEIIAIVKIENHKHQVGL